MCFENHDDALEGLGSPQLGTDEMAKDALSMKSKLAMARDASGLTDDQLAAKTDGLAPERIKAFERDGATPNDEEIAALAVALDVSEAFLRSQHDVALADVQYRCRRTVLPEETLRLRLRTTDLLTRYFEVEQLLGLPPREWHPPPSASFDVGDVGSIEEAAAIARNSWMLGERPIGDIAGILDSHGVKVLQIADGDIDGLIAKIVIDGADAGRLIVVRRLDDTDRMRFTLAHEIGHLLSSSDIAIEAEDAMNRFARAFLMPPQPFLAELNRLRTGAPRIDQLAGLSARFGLSMQALVARCTELGVVDETQKTQLMKALAPRRPGASAFQESDGRFERLCRLAVARGLIGIDRAAALLGRSILNADDFLAEGAVDAFAPYPYAVVRIATYTTEEMAAPLLVFATVEMLTSERAVPDSSANQVHVVAPAFGGGKMRFSRVAMRGDGAVAWYADAGRGRLTIPMPLNDADRRRGEHGTGVQASPLSHEPGWPEFVLPLERDPLFDRDRSGPSMPFIGAGAKPARLTRLLAVADDRLAAIAEDRAAMAFLKPRLHIDLWQYPEYRGGLALFAPDPIVRAVSLFVRPRKDADGGGEDVVLRVLPRQHASLDDLRLTVFELRAGALSKFETVDVPRNGLITAHRRHASASVGFILAHPDYGVLRHQTPISFLRFISAGDAAAQEKLDPVRQLTHGEGARRRVAEVSKAGQRWLDDLDTARIHMRDLLQAARVRVWIADPEMTGAAIFGHLGAIRRGGVEIRLMTSTAALGDNGARTVAGVSATAQRAAFVKQIETLEGRGHADMKAFIASTGVLSGHFLVVDDNAWTCSVSFDRLGEMSAFMLKVPDPNAVISRLNWVQTKAQPLTAQDLAEDGDADGARS